MLPRSIMTLLLWMSVSNGLSAQTLKARTSAAEDSIINVGITLYDKGEYDQAISCYRTVLKANPANVTAYAELAMTYMAKQQYSDAIQTALQGLKYESNNQAVLYSNLGNAYDMDGSREKAIMAYMAGLAIRASDPMLHFNLGLTYHRGEQLDSARFHYQAALRSKPSHAASNLALSQIYQAMNKRIPAIFALSRFLILEPTSRRSMDAAIRLQRLLADSLSITSAGVGEMTIHVTPDSDDVDGDMSSLALSLAMAQAANRVGDSSFASPLYKMASELSTLFQISSELLENEHFYGFCWSYYVPYFSEMQNHGFTNVAVRHMFPSTDKQEVLEYVRLHQQEATDFKSWNSQYSWK